jgi:hypothetical protein
VIRPPTTSCPLCRLLWAAAAPDWRRCRPRVWPGSTGWFVDQHPRRAAGL